MTAQLYPCSRCRQNKPREEMGKYASGHNGLDIYCLRCKTIKRAERQARLIAEGRVQRKVYHRTCARPCCGNSFSSAERGRSTYCSPECREVRRIEIMRDASAAYMQRHPGRRRAAARMLQEQYRVIARGKRNPTYCSEQNEESGFALILVTGRGGASWWSSRHLGERLQPHEAVAARFEWDGEASEWIHRLPVVIAPAVREVAALVAKRQRIGEAV